MGVLKSCLWRGPANHMPTASLHRLMLQRMQALDLVLYCCQTEMLHTLAQLNIKLESAQQLCQSTVHAHAITCIDDMPNVCRLLRWGTSTAAELAAAYNANAGVQFGSADLAAQHKLLRWGSSTAVGLAAADAAHGQEPQSDSQSGQDLPSEDDWTGSRLAEPAWQESILAPARQEVQRPAARTASR